MSFANRQQIGLVVLLLLPILALRLYRFALPGTPVDPAAPLTTLPPGLDSDEAFHTLAALRLTHGEITPFFKIDQGIPAAMIYGIALLLPLLGPVAEAGRWVSALAGLGLLVCLPLLARQLWSAQPQVALVTLAHTGFIFWFVNFSRLGLEQITCTLLVALTFLVFTQWLQHNTWRWATATGILLALSLYSYPAAYVTPLALGLALVYHHLTTRTKPNWKHLATFALAFVCVAAPLLIFFYLNPDWATRRATQTVGSFNPLGTLAGLFWSGDTIARHNIPGRPLLDPVQSLLLILGVLICLRRWRDPNFAIPLIWLGVLLMPPALSAEPEHFGRLAGAMGAIALIAALGTIPIVTLLPRWGAVILMVAALTYSAARTAYDYFSLWPQTPGYSRVFNVVERIQAETTLALVPDSSVYISPSDRSRPMFLYLWNDRYLAQSFNGRACTVFPTQTDRTTTWLVNDIEDPNTAAALKMLYAETQSRSLLAEGGTLTLEQVTVAPGTSARVPLTGLGQVDQLLEINDLEVSPLQPDGSLSIKLLWRVLNPTPENWTMGLYLLNANNGVVAQDDRQPCDTAYISSAWQPNELIAETRTLSLPTDLPNGNYQLALALYRLSDGQRLPTTARDGTHATLLNLATLTLP